MEDNSANQIVKSCTIYFFIGGFLIWLIGAFYLAAIRIGGPRGFNLENILWLLICYVFGLIVASPSLIIGLLLWRKRPTGRYGGIIVSIIVGALLTWFTVLGLIYDSFRIMPQILLIPGVLAVVSFAVAGLLFHPSVKALFAPKPAASPPKVS